MNYYIESLAPAGKTVSRYCLQFTNEKMSSGGFIWLRVCRRLLEEPGAGPQMVHIVLLPGSPLGSLEHPSEVTILVYEGHHYKVPPTGWVSHRNLFSHSSGGWIFDTKVSAGLTPSEASLPGLQMAIFSCIFKLSPFRTCLCPNFFFTSVILDQGLH